MLDYGLNLTAINGELGRMIELGNKLYFRKKRYVYSSAKGKTFSKFTGSGGEIREQLDGGAVHIISVPVAIGEVVKVTPMTINPRVSLMTWYRNSVEQVFLTKGSDTVDWLIEVYAPNPVSAQYGLEICGDGEVLWSSESATLFPVAVSSPMYFDNSGFDWMRLESKGVESGFGRIGVILDPSQNAITRGAANTSGAAIIFAIALGFCWRGNFELTSDFMVAAAFSSFSYYFDVANYSLFQNFNTKTKLNSYRIYPGVNAGDWLNTQVSVFRGEKWKNYTDSGPTTTGVYDPTKSVFFGRSTGMLCYTDL